MTSIGDDKALLHNASIVAGAGRQDWVLPAAGRFPATFNKNKNINTLHQYYKIIFVFGVQGDRRNEI